MAAACYEPRPAFGAGQRGRGSWETSALKRGAAIAMAELGMSCMEIVDALGWHHSTVYYHLGRLKGAHGRHTRKRQRETEWARAEFRTRLLAVYPHFGPNSARTEPPRRAGL